MDAFERDDIERTRKLPPAAKLAQALEMMAIGMRLQRCKLQRQHPSASPEQLERKFADWLQHDD